MENNMSTLPTAEEWLSNHKELSVHDVASYDEGGYLGVDERALYTIMVEFAKLHVEQALKTASQNASLNYDEWDDMAAYIDRDSIENAYPLTNIK